MAPVTLMDPVYGEVRFTEPLLIDVYHSQAVQRLRHINQGGITAFIRPERRTTRLDHSLGVAALLRLLGADVIEQAAGLIHDVTHTAFSHVVDFVFPNREHTYHEAHREAWIAASDLPDILSRYGLDWRWVGQAEHFPLLEQPLPRLCADRLDYFLRDAVVDVGLFTAEQARAWLAHLQVREGQIVVDDLDAARWLGVRFMMMDERIWCSVQEVGWYAVMARALQAALSSGVITEADFAGTDAAVLARLRESSEPQVHRWLGLLRAEVDFVRDSERYDLAALPKPRAVDPTVWQHGEAHPLSEIDGAYALSREAYLRDRAGEWKLRIVTPSNGV